MLDIHPLIIIVIVLALAFDFINGFHDTANAIATSVSTRAISPSHAIMMAAVLNFFGALVSTASPLLLLLSPELLFGIC